MLLSAAPSAPRTCCFFSSSSMRCPISSRRHVIACGSSGSTGSSTKKAAVRTKTSPSSCGAGSPTAVSAAAATATVNAAASSAADPAAGGAAAAVAALKNPPLGFANNILPAGPLVAHPAGSSHSPDGYASDEELDGGMSSGSSTPGTGRSHAYRCLVLDSRYLPVNVVSWFRAVVMGESGKVDVLEFHPGGFAYSAYKAHPLPAVLRVRTFVDVFEFAGRLSLTRKNIMLRDHHNCQYCGSNKELTLDHVTPVCRGGLNSWTNLVTACMDCNQKKGNKSLQQLGWRLPAVPREPTPQEVGVIAGISKSDLESPPAVWVPYLASHKALLDKAKRRSAAQAAAMWNPGTGSSGTASMPGQAGSADSSIVTLHAAGPKSKQAKAEKAVAGKANAGSAAKRVRN